MTADYNALLPACTQRKQPSNGDGGNRTHVRGRVKDSFYERSRPSDLVPRSPGRPGSSGPASVDVPPGPEAHRGGKPVFDAGHLPHGPRGGRQLIYLVLA